LADTVLGYSAIAQKGLAERMIGMDQYELIRTANRVYAKSIRAIAREYGHSRKTIRKALAGMEPRYRRHKEPYAPIMGPFASTVEAWLKRDRDIPPKQRHTARRAYTRLIGECGFTGSEATVRVWVRQCKERLGYGSKQAVIPLDPECAREAEVDWGTAQVRMGGQLQTVKIFCMRSRYSGKSFVCAYPWERQEMFFDGHIRAFAFYGGVFPVLVFDNLKVAVRTILRGKKRVEQKQFIAFRSYYTFEARFCNPDSGREKGGVEGIVGFARRNFLVPIPEVADFEELNKLLLERCLAHGYGIISGREDRRTINERHEQERSRLLSLPQKPFENIKPVQVRISSYQTAQVDRNRYSVPSAYVGRKLWAHIDCDRVRVYADRKIVADHPRLFSNSKWQIDPQHYLDLIAERIQAFESARAIRQWRSSWPQKYETMLSILRKRLGDNKGIRDFVRILQLHQNHPAADVERAVEEALEYSSYSHDAVKHLLLSRKTQPPSAIPLDSNLMPGITDRVIAASDLNRYDALLTGGAL
jgi:transposase